MTQPTLYIPDYDFSAYQGLNPTLPLPGDRVDTEFGNIQLTLDEVLANLAMIQRDDGDLANQSVSIDQLDADVRALLALTDAEVRGAWVTATSYVPKDVVSQGGVAYLCVTAHVSGTFATDLAAVKWIGLTPTYTAFGASLLAAANAGAAVTLLGVSSFIATLLDDADAATARTTLGASKTIAAMTADTTGGAHADIIPFLDADESNAENQVTVANFFKNVITGGTDTTPANFGDMSAYELLVKKISDGSLHKMLLAEMGPIAPGGIVTGSATIDFASVADNATSAASTVTVNGVVAGDFVLSVSASGNIDTTAGVDLLAAVSGANTVSVYLHNDSGGAFDAASQTIYVVCLKKAAVGL